jgi:competence protein ComEC
MPARLGRAIETWLEIERDQIALWLPVGLGGGIAAWFVLPDRFGWSGAAAVFAGIALGALLIGRGTRAARGILVLALAMLVGLAIIWAKASWVAAPRIDRPTVATFAARIEAVDPLPARDLVRLRLAPDPGAGLPPRVRVNVDAKELAAEVPVGSRIELRARLLPPAPPMVPGGYDFARAAWFQGLGATGKAIGKPVLHPAAEAGFWSWLWNLRVRISAHIRDSIAGEGEAGIATSFVTGDQGGIPEADNEALRRAGLAHLLSVSGLHVSAVVGGMMFLALRLLALSPRLALHAPLVLISAAIGALAGVAYTLLAGAEVPTIRSCVAALLVLGGIALGREAMTLRLVAAGALIVLLCWPEALAGPSFQLSFAAIASLVAFHEHPRVVAFGARREEAWLWRMGRAVLLLLATGLVTELALSPIALFHFHKQGLYGAAANIVAIPLTTFVVMPLEAFALLLDAVGLGAPIWWLTGKTLSFLLWIAHAVASAPGSVASLPSMPWGAFALMVAGGLWIVLWRTRVRRLGMIPLAAGALWSWLTPAPDLLVTGDGRHVAIRTGDGGIVLLRERAGDYVRDALGEASGVEGEAPPIDALSGAQCNRDLCLSEIGVDGRRWRILATRSPYMIDIRAMNRACRLADIAISDRRLPRSCSPRWLKADLPLLRTTGGLAIRLPSAAVETVAEHVGDHPWSTFRRPEQVRPRPKTRHLPLANVPLRPQPHGKPQ